ncbi:MAG: CorA family divalent cation transporter [Rhodoblastus sp.]|uniref:CorA family divalent cation transporter n=1 Tax=Rhodoblastus sp. TaxID=1962975 RepID=UPI003F9CC568
METVRVSPPQNGDGEIEGLVWGCLFSESGAAELLHGDDLREAIEKQEDWLWLNFDLADEGTRTAIASLPHLPPQAVAMLLLNDDRQHIDSFWPMIGGVVADFENSEQPDLRRMVRWNFVMAPHLFISARRQPGLILQQVSRDLQTGRRLPDVLRLFDALIHEFTSSTSFILHDLSNKLDEMEEKFWFACGLMVAAIAGMLVVLRRARLI